MTIAFAMLVQIGGLKIDGPDLADVERAVGKCDSKTMTKIFSAEPQRRREAVIAVFNEQQAIVEARRTLAERRHDALARPATGKDRERDASGMTIAPPSPPVSQASLDAEAQSITDRQQALDDTRMLSTMRDNALDMMRQQYLTTCNSALADASK